MDRVVGGWTLRYDFTFQSGAPFYLSGGFNTFNNIGDGGVALSGVTTSQLQSSMGIYRSGNPYAYALNPATFVSANGQARSVLLHAQRHSRNAAASRLAIWASRDQHRLGSNEEYTDSRAPPFQPAGGDRSALNHPNWGNPSNGAAGGQGALSSPSA